MVVHRGLWLLLLVAWGCAPASSGDGAGMGAFVARDKGVDADPSDLGLAVDDAATGGPALDVAMPDGLADDGAVDDVPAQDAAADDSDGALPDEALPDGPPLDGSRPDGPLPDGPLLDGPLTDGPLPDGPLPDGPLLDGAADVDTPDAALDGMVPDAFEVDANEGDDAAQLCTVGECDGENLDDLFQDNSSLGGPWIAMRWVPVEDLLVTGFEVFTGERAGENGLSLWTSVGNSPGALLSGGVFQADLENKWQGTQLGEVVGVEAGAVYWIVWRPVAGAQSSFGPPGQGVAVSYRGSADQGRSWNGPFQAPAKFRVLCCGGGGGG